MASGDFDGDGLVDLVVGAPMFKKHDAIKEMDIGRVYVVYQARTFQVSHFKDFASIDGISHKGKFGLSVACAGNLNMDGISANKNGRGIQDFIVGAPYDGPEQSGAVYVFYGSNERKFNVVSESHSVKLSQVHEAVPTRSN